MRRSEREKRCWWVTSEDIRIKDRSRITREIWSISISFRCPAFSYSVLKKEFEKRMEYSKNKNIKGK